MFPVPTIVISLKRAHDRREHAVEELKKHGAEWEILDATDGLKLHHHPPEYNERKVSKLLGFPLTLSEIGCFLSHREAWIYCIEKQKSILILEDDFVLRPNIKVAIRYLLDNEKIWDIARLQAILETPHTIISKSDTHQIVENHSDPLGATAYILKPSAAKKLLIHSSDIYEPLDHYLEHHKKHGLKILAIKPYPVDINGSETTIFDRPERNSISGYKKFLRSISRCIDRLVNPNPWFPK